jgi:hypothetical protein
VKSICSKRQIDAIKKAPKGAFFMGVFKRVKLSLRRHIAHFAIPEATENQTENQTGGENDIPIGAHFGGLFDFRFTQCPWVRSILEENDHEADGGNEPGNVRQIMIMRQHRRESQCQYYKIRNQYVFHLALP